MIRLGGPIFQPYDSPETWVIAVQQAGYSAAYCPLEPGTDAATVAAYVTAAQAADILIAEVGVWNNPLSNDSNERAVALEKCRESLALADQINANCCVNIAGSRGAKWDGSAAANYDPDTFDLIVTTVRAIIDDVRPRRTFYTLETMPWMLPDSPESYLTLIRAIDRPSFAVHFDPVNLINSPRRYYQQEAFLTDCLTQLGPYIKSCHAKDLILRSEMLVHLEEVQPGQGGFAYPAFLHCLAQLPRDIPLMLEHLDSEAAYQQSGAYIQRVAADNEIPLK